MAASPAFKVYNSEGGYEAACKDPEAAALLVSFYGTGATIRLHHRRILWTEGQEKFPAQESYDGCAEIMFERMAARLSDKVSDASERREEARQMGFES